MADQTQPRGEAEALKVYLTPTAYLDSDHPSIRALATEAAAGGGDQRAQAVRLYYIVRDRILYDPYALEMVPETFQASRVLASGRGYCVAKAALLAAAARSLGVPARLGFADVRNHLATERLLRLIGTDTFYYHGYTDLYLGGRWVKATPAFNIELCRKFCVLPLEFDGENDSIFHPFDAENRRHMEYLHDRGTRPDVPFDELRDAMHRHYPRMFAGGRSVGGDFAAEAEIENRVSQA